MITGDRSLGFIDNRRFLSPVITGSKLFLFVRGVSPDWGGLRPLLRSTPTLTVELHPIAIDMSPAEAGSEFRRPRLPNSTHPTSKIQDSTSSLLPGWAFLAGNWRAVGQRNFTHPTSKIKNSKSKISPCQRGVVWCSMLECIMGVVSPAGAIPIR